MLQTVDDFNGLEGCRAILEGTRPGLVEIRHVHVEAVADAVETKYVRLQSG